MRFAGDKSNASLLLAVPVIPVFLGDADRGKLGPLMLLRVESTVVGSCPVPIDKPLEPSYKLSDMELKKLCII